MRFKGKKTETPGNMAFATRLDAIAGRGRLEMSAYPNFCEATKPETPVRRRFWSPYDLTGKEQR